MAENNVLSALANKKLVFSEVVSDIIGALKTLIFPFSSEKVLNRVQGLLSSKYSCPEKALEVYFANKIIQEFLLCENEQSQTDLIHKTSYRQRELQLLLKLFDYFGSPSVSSSENALKIVVFLTLFNSEHPVRWPILVKLVSMAISLENEEILMATSILTYQLSKSSELSTQLVGGIVQDFILLYPDSISKLKVLPVKVPVFCIMFMRKVTKLYGKNFNKPWTSVPNLLLEIIVEWMENHNSQFLSILNAGLRLYFPDGQATIPVFSPFSGLLKWTILSSLYEKDKRSQELFILLHLTICKSLTIANGECKSCLMRTDSFISIINDIKRAMELSTSAEKLDDCLIRLAQSIQLAVHSRAVHGDLREVITKLDDILILRPHRLLRIVVNRLKMDLNTSLKIVEL